MGSGKFYVDKMTDVIISVGSDLEGSTLRLCSTIRVESVSEVVSNKLIRLEEQAIRDALISLGWTPPADSPEFMSEEWWQELRETQVKGMYL